VLVAESGLGAVRAIDPRTRRPTGRLIRVGSDPDSIAGDATSLWVTNSGSNTVSVLSPGGTGRRDVTVGQRPEGVALGFGSAWIANSGDGTVSRVDLATKRVATTIAVGARPVFVLVAYGSVWTADSAGNTVSRIAPTTNRVAATIAVGRNPRALAAQDGLWVANGNDGTVSRIDPRKQRVRHTTPAFARNLKGMVADNRHGVVWVSDPDGRRLWRVTTTPGDSDRVLAPKAVPAAPWSLVRTADAIWASDTSGSGVVAVPNR
jgi:YVTN family beta-propeller protein